MNYVKGGGGEGGAAGSGRKLSSPTECWTRVIYRIIYKFVQSQTALPIGPCLRKTAVTLQLMSLTKWCTSKSEVAMAILQINVGADASQGSFPHAHSAHHDLTKVNHINKFMNENVLDT